MSNTHASAIRPVLLVVDDEPAVRTVIARFAERYGFEIISCADGREALELLQTRRAIDIALVDVRLPHVDGMELLKSIRSTMPGCHVIVMSGATSVGGAVEAIRQGALDYLTKPIDFDRLSSLFSDLRAAAVVEDAPAAPSTVSGDFHGMIGASAGMAEVRRSIEQMAPYARVALITGETGTGKELAARALHESGPRARQRFVTVNCSAVVETLFESELFGHMKGAFTGAIADKAGLFEQAHRGTLFLDEIGELPLAMQAKLLRVLESGELLRVGSLQAKSVDVHVVAATNRDLRVEVAAGRFRQDLLFRINMIEIPLPPLRTRLEDVPEISAAFLTRFARQMGKHVHGFTPAAEAAMRGAAWPGNVRELRNVIERACMVADSDVIGIEHLRLTPEASFLSSRGVAAPASTGFERPTLAVIEREHLVRALTDADGNKAKAADLLGISRRAFYRRLEKHGLDQAIQRRPLYDAALAVA